MTIHYKVGGEWIDVQRVYLKKDDVWIHVGETYVKDGGTWKMSHEYDVLPPDPPVVTLEVEDTTYWENGNKKSGRYIKVGARTPLGAHDTDLKMIRVLSTYNGKMPTTQYGGNYISQPADGSLEEPWSDRYYNGYNGSSKSKDSSVTINKRWPRNATNSTNVASGWHYFAAWSLDQDGNWSEGTFAQIWVPKKGVASANVKIREARFQATDTGYYEYGTSAFVNGTPQQGRNPRRVGLFFYGNGITNTIGEFGTPTIRKAQIRIERKDDAGVPLANVHLVRHKHPNAGDMGTSEPVFDGGSHVLGTIGKGETKWFDLPDNYLLRLAEDNVKGFGLYWKDDNLATANESDYLVVNSVSESLRTGELHVVWEEAL